MTTYGGARVVTPDRVLDPGWVRVEQHRIAAVGEGRPPGDVQDLGGAWVLPGFVDLHVHGGGGHDVARSPADLAAAVAFHRGHGTTRTLVSLMTTPVADMRERVRWISQLADAGPRPDGHVVGAHLEGPFIAASHCGAQNPAYLQDPDRATLASLLGEVPGVVRSITIAPELPGAIDLVSDAVAAGSVVAVGHTGTGYDAADAAFAAGATLVTHLGNAMPPMAQREPGPIGAALRRGMYCEVIADGHHVHPALLSVVPAERLVLITDAMSATGSADGEYDFAGQPVAVADGVARLSSNGSLAGSTLTLDAAVRFAVQRAELPITVAAAAASTNPARVLGLRDVCGAIEPGLDADLVVLDDELRLVRVMAQGRWCE